MCELTQTDDETTLPALRVEIYPEADHVVVAVCDEVDMVNAEQLPALVVAAASGYRSVLIDLAEVTFVDSSGLRALLMCEAALARDGVAVRLVNPAEQARRVLEIAGLAYLLG